MSETTPTGANNPFEWDVDDGEVESPDHIEDGDAYIDALAAGFDSQTIMSEAEWAGASTADSSSSDGQGVPTSVDEARMQWYAIPEGDRKAILVFTVIGLAGLAWMGTEAR